ncbi:MAG: hypothetical protein V8S99_11015 [Oscillospiraceae bacterium]
MMRLDIKKLFVSNHVLHRAPVFLRHAAVYKLVADRQHFIAAHRTAFQQNFADRQNFSVRQPLRRSLCQAITARSAVIVSEVKRYAAGV